ncbi:MAG: PTS sugar transporter subunit IIA [Phycisphaerae bacterium]|nr:PTS sugar transporter subunit IIA [Phycisphaerae bacterium]
MKLSELLRSECICVHSTADDKALALCEIARLAKQCDVLKNVSEEAILEAFQDRETLGSTAFGNGIAIPHCRVRGVKDFVVGLMTIPQGAEFEADDRKKVQLIVFIIAPRQQSDMHIRLLSAISQVLQDDTSVRKMIEADDVEQLRRAFLEAGGEDISEQLQIHRNLVHVFVQDENVFREILEALRGLENISLSVLRAESPRTYLLPSVRVKENENHPCRVIAAVIERRLSNEVIRRVEAITGSLLECMGVLVAVQELDYSAGSLEI